MSQHFLIDTSMFINGWTKHYPPDIFPTFWSKLEVLIESGTVFSCEAVYDELKRQDDDLLQWAKQHKSMFRAPTEDVTYEMKYVMHHFPNFAAQGGSGNDADPWVIAHAKIEHATVVTDEQPAERQRDTKPPKIPDVCAGFGIPWMSIVQFLAANKLTF